MVRSSADSWKVLTSPGTGLLATPIAIAYAGWILGPLFLILVGAMTNRTCFITSDWSFADTRRLKILVKIMDRDQRLRNYTDAVSYVCVVSWKPLANGQGLGPKSEKWIKSLFLLEVSVWT